MRRKIVAGNWKMNGSRDLVRQLMNALRESLDSMHEVPEVVVFPPALYVGEVLEHCGPSVSVGVQNIGQWVEGAYTGELSAGMVRDVGCGYALIGHSERRQWFGETDEVIAEKVRRALDAGLTAMLCVGETLEERDTGAAESIVAGQLRQGLAQVGTGEWSQVVIAYEPVWAIGTGKTASASDAQAMHAGIRRVLAELNAPATELSVLYGGSVKADNAAALFAEPDIDGGLIGGASLKAEDFLSICRSMPAGA